MTRKLSTCKKWDFLQRKEKEKQGSFLKRIPLEATLSWLSRVYAMMLKCALFANPKHFFSCSVGFALSFHRVSKLLKKSHYSHLLGHFVYIILRFLEFFNSLKHENETFYLIFNHFENVLQKIHRLTSRSCWRFRTLIWYFYSNAKADQKHHSGALICVFEMI